MLGHGAGHLNRVQVSPARTAARPYLLPILERSRDRQALRAEARYHQIHVRSADVADPVPRDSAVLTLTAPREVLLTALGRTSFTSLKQRAAEVPMRLCRLLRAVQHRAR